MTNISINNILIITIVLNCLLRNEKKYIEKYQYTIVNTRIFLVII
jgi:hypothetical protein